MIVLGFDTATSTASIALVRDGTTIAETTHDMTGRTNDLLVPIDELVRGAGLAPHDLDAIAVGAGPGSFTGLRVGMATAKGIAFATNRPLWTVSSLAALAAQGRGDIRVAALDARKGEVYAGVYAADGTLLGAEACVAPSELAAWVSEILQRTPAAEGRGSCSYVGDAAEVFDELRALDFQLARPRGDAVARIAPRVDVLSAGRPSYVRPAEAEVMYPDGVPGALRKR